MTGPPALDAGTLRVATFNIRNGRALDGWNSWPFRRRAVADTIANLDADLLGLQEVFAFQLRWLRGRLPGYLDVGAGRGVRGGERCPVLFRAGRARLLDHRTRWFGEEPDHPGSRLPGARFPRIATVCRLELVPGGRHLQLACTHLDERAERRRIRSAEQLAGWLDPDLPRIVVGDLNAEPGSPVLAELESAGLRPALPADAPGGTSHRFSGSREGRRIDHVLVSGHFEVVAASVAHAVVGERLPSDHWPVVAELRLTGAGPAGP
ncbi:MAG TPA: endonuclease/exonuclease/phosphatase family protein [Acidimicrobiales bacterium]|nr:endonuclease/exonuclease/phosphatase family protein [Acidimicrobiales bacterium]